GKDEERDREQREAVDAARDLDHHRLERDVDPERAEDCGEAERVGDRHADHAQHDERAEEDDDVDHSASGWSRYITEVGGGMPSQSRSTMKSSVNRPPTGIGR